MEAISEANGEGLALFRSLSRLAWVLEGLKAPPGSQAAVLGRPSSSPLGWVVGGGLEERKQWAGVCGWVLRGERG